MWVLCCKIHMPTKLYHWHSPRFLVIQIPKQHQKFVGVQQNSAAPVCRQSQECCIYFIGSDCICCDVHNGWKHCTRKWQAQKGQWLLAPWVSVNVSQVTIIHRAIYGFNLPNSTNDQWSMTNDHVSQPVQNVYKTTRTFSMASSYVQSFRFVVLIITHWRPNIRESGSSNLSLHTPSNCR